MEPVMSGIRVQPVEPASGRTGFASGQARVEAVATGMRNSIFLCVFHAFAFSGEMRNRRSSRGFPCFSKSKKVRKTPKSPIFRAVKL
jgi:hypothetical protein